MRMKVLLLIMTAVNMLLVPSCTMKPINSPIITSLESEAETVFPSGSCQIVCTASDPDGGELSYEWSASRGEIDGEGATVIWTAPDSEGVYNIAVTVTDARGGEVTDHITITVMANNPPVITSLTADADWTTPSGSLQVKCDAEDPDGDELSYEWSASRGDISGTGPEVTWAAPEAAGMHDIQVVVTDGYGGEATRSLIISVAPYSPPVIEDLIVTADHRYFGTTQWGYEIGKETSCQIECLASAAMGGELSYGWSASDGELSGEGSVVTWTAPNTYGEVTVTVTVSDTTGNMVSESIVFGVVSCSVCKWGRG